MLTSKTRTKSIDRAKYSVFLKKAQEFYDTMLMAQQAGNWNAVGLNAVHCAISANDALLAYHAGLRCTSQSHDDAVNLLQMNVPLEDARTMATSLRRIIAQKNLVEYEARDFRRRDAEDIAKRAERFLSWAKKVLP